jgi:hypothetical protein
MSIMPWPRGSGPHRCWPLGASLLRGELIALVAFAVCLLVFGLIELM